LDLSGYISQQMYVREAEMAYSFILTAGMCNFYT